MNETDEAFVQALMRDVDRTLLRENLKLTLEQRVQKHLRAAQMKVMVSTLSILRT
jgi:phage terminase Nu1 subunit (DNA packaging protein)